MLLQCPMCGELNDNFEIFRVLILFYFAFVVYLSSSIVVSTKIFPLSKCAYIKVYMINGLDY
jgi:hypothetical protein